MANVPHLAYPFRLAGRSFAVRQQDTADEVTDCVYAVLATPVGSRLEDPEFGVYDQSFLQGGADLDELEGAVRLWEPRAVMLTEATWEALVETLRIEVRVAE